MVPLLSLLERAKQGDVGAIAVLMNDALQTQEVWVKVTLDHECLQIMLKSRAVLNQVTCIAFIQRGLLSLQPKSVEQVRVYAWRVSDAFPLWIATFFLKQDALLQGQLKAVINQPLTSTRADLPWGDGTSASLQPPIQTITLKPPAAKQRAELLKLGFVIVLMTMAYFVVAGV